MGVIILILVIILIVSLFQGQMQITTINVELKHKQEDYIKPDSNVIEIVSVNKSLKQFIKIFNDCKTNPRSKYIKR
jgi:hypothetical protein